jgi:pyruvate carboxylase
MLQNRGEIAIRVMRAANELGMNTVAIFSKEDRFTQHRYKADQGFMVEHTSPVGAYLDIHQVISIAAANKVQAIHPGYGFLSERADFAQACADHGIVFVGPTPENLSTFGDKTSARELALRMGVPCVPGTDGAVETFEQARDFIEGTGVGYPVIIKAAMGGGGRGMRVVTKAEDLQENFYRATGEAQAAFGDGSVFIERYVDRPRHIEVQIVGDGTGSVVHLWDRDCSVQRRHQKVVETAPAMSLPPATRQAMLDDAVRLTSEAKYLNAGTVEFLVDAEGRHYFIEVNPRIQVEHTVTEQVRRGVLAPQLFSFLSVLTLDSHEKKIGDRRRPGADPVPHCWRGNP